MDDRVQPDVILQPLHQDLAAALFALTDRHRRFLRDWLPWLDQVRTVDDTRHFIESAERMATSNSAPTFAIIHAGTLCGVTGFHSVNKAHCTGSIGYWLGQDHTGQGIATAAVRQLITIGFTECGLNRIEIRCAVNNRQSRTLPERLGFIHEGTLRQSERLYGRFLDQALYALLASDSHASDSGSGK